VKVINPTGRIYLTFDDGPSDYTASLLDVLAKYNVKATFFVTGYGDDALIRREYDEGHAIGLHTNSHIYSYVYSSVDNYMADLNAVGDRVRRITGKATKLMRFPGGSSNMISAYYDGGSKIMSKLVGLMNEQGYTYFDWNVDSKDAGGAKTPEEVLENVITGIEKRSVSVVLQHDIHGFSVDAVERIINWGLSQGYTCLPLTESSPACEHNIRN
jgi:peptidoglycan/xylan/chitin deacetylase (PgdA/CDA1 family)